MVVRFQDRAPVYHEAAPGRLGWLLEGAGRLQLDAVLGRDKIPYSDERFLRCAGLRCSRFPAAQSAPSVEVVAVAARDVGRARHPTCTRRLRGTASRPGGRCDLQPAAERFAWSSTMAAIRAGKHVLCEKPFAANGQEARAVADMASGNGKAVFGAFHYR